MLVFFFLFTLVVSFPTVNDKVYNRTMEWGTYNPQIFFGLKNRSPQPTTLGLMWRKTQNYGTIRHETPGSDINYGWEMHDGSHFGSQVIKDRKLNLKLTTQFLKSEPEDENQSPYIVARIIGEKLFKNREIESISIMPYLTTQGKDRFVKSKSKETQKGVVCCPVILMDEEESFRAYIFTESLGKKKKTKVSYQGGYRPSDEIWKMSDIKKILYEQYIKERKKQLRKAGDEEAFEMRPFDLSLGNKAREQSNFYVLDFHFTEFPFTVDVALIPKGSIPQNNEKKTTEYIRKKLVGESLTSMIEERKSKFNKKFEEKFGLKKNEVGKGYVDLGKFALSNLLGGLGYFHGDMLFEERNQVYTRNVTQFSCVPSRSQFPRPFLWDEGFHLELLMKWNEEIAKDVLLHWFHTMDPRNGWIPREQILGDEGRSRVPEKFIMQSTTIANPPTLFMAIEDLIFSKAKTNKVSLDETVTISTSHEVLEKDRLFLDAVYPHMKMNYEWYMKTQRKENRFAFQWGGRTENHTLASGFDDYPRGTIEPMWSERHLDLFCWMYMITKTMGKIAKTLGKDKDVEYFKNMKQTFEDEVTVTHFDEEQDLFADFVGDYDSNFTSSNGFSTHFGYVSLFPMISEIVKPKGMGDLWKRIFNKEYMLSKYGLLSLSRNDRLFGSKENYWRGKIWINMNYMVLKSLHNKKFAAKGYKKLRDALMKNMLSNYKAGKTIFENYDPNTGEGTGTSPFCGWSALILLIMSEKY